MFNISDYDSELETCNKGESLNYARKIVPKCDLVDNSTVFNISDHDSKLESCNKGESLNCAGSIVYTCELIDKSPVLNTISSSVTGVSTPECPESTSPPVTGEPAGSQGTRGTNCNQGPSHAEFFLNLNQRVRESGVPNYIGCQVPIPSNLKLRVWDVKLQNYQDRGVATFMRYGWPIGLSGCVPSTTGKPRNHGGAREFPKHVEKYIEKEVGLGALLGPFDNNPLLCNLHMSPINTVDKKCSADRRVIVDLSFPEGSSVNDGIDKHMNEGQRVDLEYPSVDNLVTSISDLGPTALLYKRDLRRTYRQIPVCPGDIHHLGISWRGKTFIDRVLPFGLRSAAMICQRVTSAVSFMLSNDEGYEVINYLDDFGGAELPDNAFHAYEALGSTLAELGLDEASDKASPPSSKMEFLGVLFDAANMEMRVTPDRLTEIDQLLKSWSGKEIATRNELESLIGKLQFVA